MLIFCNSELLRAVRRQLTSNGATREKRATLVLPILTFTTARTTNDFEVINSLLPETIAHELHDIVSPLGAAAAVKAIRSHAGSEPPAGTLLGVSGRLLYEGEERSFHGVPSLAVRIEGDNYELRAFVAEQGREQVDYYNGQVVTVYGVCQWTPPYKPGSGAQLSVGLQVAAMFSD